MTYQPTIEPKFLATLQTWIEKQAEILLMVRYRAGAGRRDFEFFTSFTALQERLQALPPGACVTAFKQAQLPLRGIVDGEFIEKALKLVPDGAEYLMTEMSLTVAGKHSWIHYGSGTSHKELRDDLQESNGVRVAVGLYPPVLKESEEVIDAVVPDSDGVVRAGPY